MVHLPSFLLRSRPPGVIALVAVLAFGLSACGGGDHKVPAGAVASVDGKPIADSEFAHWINVVARTQQQQAPGSKRKPKLPKPGSPEYKQVANQVMQFLVSSRWISGEAADRDLSASPEEVKRSFERTRDQSFPNKKAYERFLRTSGQSQTDIDFRVRSDVLATKVRQEVTKDAQQVSDDDIKEYYKQNEAQFSQPERRDIQVVVNKDEKKAREALSQLQNGEDFKKVVKALSTDPATKQQQGRQLGIAKGQQEKALDDAVFGAPKDKLVGPIKTQQGFYVFKVTRITPATKQSLDQSKEGIRQLLISQTQQKALDNFTQGFRQKWRDKTDCRKPYVIPDCSNGEEQQTTAGGGPPARSGTGTPPALGGGAIVPQAGATPGIPGGGAPTPTGGAAAGPPALGPGGPPPALGGVPAQTTGVPQGVPQQGVPQQQGAPPQQGAPQQGAPQQGAPQQQGAPPGG
jgi:foldase protein PrsA